MTEMINVSTILEEAQELTGGDRNDDYGHPYHDFKRTADMVTAMIEHKLKPGERITEEDWARFMVCCKLSRDAHKPKRDNLVDGAGYFRTLEMVREYKQDLDERTDQAKPIC